MEEAGWSPLNAMEFVRQVASEAPLRGEVRPLYRDLPQAEQFPLEALGPLQHAASEIQQVTQAPLAIVAQSVLAAATLAVQSQRDVALPKSGRKPLTCIFISIAESGERKTTVDRIASSAVLEIEAEWRAEYVELRQAYENAKEAWDAARSYLKKTKKGDLNALRLGFEALGPAPVPPPHPMLLLADTTPEALTLHLADGKPMAGVFTSEGGLLIGGSAFNEETRVRMAALLNTVWDGEPIRRRRVGTGITFLIGKRVSAHIMLQPVLAEHLLGDPLFDSMGLLARMLVVAPASTAGTRLFNETASPPSFALTNYNLQIKRLLNLPLRTKDGAPDTLDPLVLELSVDARRAWIDFYNQCEQAIGLGGALETIRPFASKLAEHAGRLAGILTCFKDPDALEINIAEMRCGVKLAIYYANEMLRLHGVSEISAKLKLADKLRVWWQQRSDPVVHLTAIYQKGPIALRDAASALACVQHLERHGIVERLPRDTIVDGAPRRDVWRLVK